MTQGFPIEPKNAGRTPEDPLGQGRRGTFSGWPLLENPERYLPRMGILLGWVAMLAFTFYACTRMVAAGDTWVAMACGRHFVNHGVDTAEPFSANSHKAGPTEEEVKTWPGWAQWITKTVGLKTVQRWHPTGWVNQNWLTHVIFYKLTTTLGSEAEPYYNALVLWKFAIYILAAAALYYTARLYGVNSALAAVFVCFAMVIGRSFFDIRPAGFSNLLVPVMILILALASYRNVLFIWLLVPLVIFWSNVHGGYVYAFLVLVPFVGWHALMRLPRRWVLTAYCILLWFVLWAMSNRFTHHEHLTAIAWSQDVLFYLTVWAIAGSIALTLWRGFGEGALTAYHVGVSCILFLLLLTRFLLEVPEIGLRPDEVKDLREFVGLAQLSFIGLFAFAMALGAVVLSFKDKVVRVMEIRGILHTVAAGLVAFVAMVVFNPFHLTNLTHTFVISISKHAERWRNVHEWHRAFAWDNPVGTAAPFLVLYILGWLVLLLWIGVSIYLSRVVDRPVRKRGKTPPAYEWAKLDLGLLIVAAMTVYMAIRSRRFIPIAAYAACPVLALLLQETLGRLLAVIALRRQIKVDLPSLGTLRREATLLAIAAALVLAVAWYVLVRHWLFFPVPGHPELRQPNLGLTLVGTVLTALGFLATAWLYAPRLATEAPPGETAKRDSSLRPVLLTASIVLAVFVVGFSTWFALMFKSVYLDPWPLDTKYTSIFMRMTASYSKPFEACEFMRLNKLSGNMFNYWTEGGCIAWGEEPDPNTGRIPLQLFMDGRAQAAYDVNTFDLWSDILSGGPLPYVAMQAQRELTPKEYGQIGEWVGAQLRKRNVWVVLMPDLQFYIPFTRGLEYSADWRLVYTDDKQKLFVDAATPKGRALFEGMFTGKTLYPNDYEANMALGYNLLLQPDSARKKEGLERLIKALGEYASPAPMRTMLLLGGQFPELRPKIDEVCLSYMEDFDKNQKTYATQDGYSFRLHVARMAAARRAQIAEALKQTAQVQALNVRIKQHEDEIDRLAVQKKW